MENSGSNSFTINPAMVRSQPFINNQLPSNNFDQYNNLYSFTPSNYKTNLIPGSFVNTKGQVLSNSFTNGTIQYVPFTENSFRDGGAEFITTHPKNKQSSNNLQRTASINNKFDVDVQLNLRKQSSLNEDHHGGIRFNRQNFAASGKNTLKSNFEGNQEDFRNGIYMPNGSRALENPSLSVIKY